MLVPLAILSTPTKSLCLILLLAVTMLPITALPAHDPPLPRQSERTCTCGGKQKVWMGQTFEYRCCAESGGAYHEHAIMAQCTGVGDEARFVACCGRLGAGPGTAEDGRCGRRGQMGWPFDSWPVDPIPGWVPW